MPQLPEDIIDRLTRMERRIQQLSTAVNTRPALNTITGGEVEISDGTLKVTDGGTLLVQRPGSTGAMFRVARGRTPSTDWRSTARPAASP